MKTDSIEFGICSNCGSTDYIEDYPVKGKRLCGKCGHENVQMELKVVKTWQEINNCPYCGKEGEEDDTLFENDDITVFKCKKCGKLDGYKFLDSSWDGLETDDGAYDSLSVKIAEQEGRSIYSASKLQEFAKALRKKEKAHTPIEKCKEQLNFLISNKTHKMNEAGISPQTIEIVRGEVQGFLEKEGPATEKQLKSVFAAALSLIQKSDRIYYRRALGKKVTGPPLEKIFGVTRKTIRKWRRVLHESSLFSRKLRLEVPVNQTEGQTEFTILDIPDEVKSLSKLKKLDKCDFCTGSKLLCWRLQLINGSRFDICEPCYDYIEPNLKEQQIC